MASVVLDTNVLLDFFETPRPEHGTSVVLMDALVKSGWTVAAVATSLKDVYYVVSKRLSRAHADSAVESILATMTILPVDFDCCVQASTSTEPDFEDGIIRAAAEIAQADYLITRDTDAFVGSRVPQISPAAAITVINHG